MWVEEQMPFHSFTQSTSLPDFRMDHNYNDWYRRQSITMSMLCLRAATTSTNIHAPYTCPHRTPSSLGTDHASPYAESRLGRALFPTVSEADRDEFSDFAERNSGTVIAVRQTAAVRNMMSLALEIYPKMLAKGWIHGNGGIADQAAFREAYFVNRKQVSEELLSRRLGCHRKEGGKTCGQNPRCLFVNG